ncbi:MAG TPA: hypothetical protein VKU19_20250 [Bryobacteraceae bacterium]|nr:hypothetical protein [Bryobacteraceae bacterium]
MRKSLKGKFNVPVPIIPRFVDTWQSKMAKHVNLTFEQGENEADCLPAKKATAFYQKIKNHDAVRWFTTPRSRIQGVSQVERLPVKI